MLEASGLACGKCFAGVVPVHVELVVQTPAVATIPEIFWVPAVKLEELLGGLGVGENPAVAYVV
jgi:hypothetical protein